MKKKTIFLKLYILIKSIKQKFNLIAKKKKDYIKRKDYKLQKILFKYI